MTMSRPQNKQLLNAVLDAKQSNGTHDEEEALDEEDIKRLANQQEQSRKRFDDVLTQPSSHWRAHSDISYVRDALVTVLDHIRGEGSDAHRMAPSSSTTDDAAKKSNADNGHGDNHDDDMGVDEFSDALEGVTPSKEHAHKNNSDNSTNSNVQDSPQSPSQMSPQASLSTRAKYIPLRLSVQERKLLRLVEAALNVSEYTDVVDVLATRGKTKQRVRTQIRDLCSILTGLAVANDYTQGQKLVSNRDFAANEAFFQDAFEVARRHKVANPEKNRDIYGKLIHMLQDSNQEDIKTMLEFACVKPMLTVHSYLDERDGLALLDDHPVIEMATREIIPDGKTRRAVQGEIHQKERAVRTLAKRHRNGSTLTDEDVRQCLYSIGDNNAYLRCARDPCDLMINYLHKYFTVDTPTDKASSLSIAEGIGGARLTHDHAMQFKYVYQSLALWREVCHEMYKLWYLSETDLLNPKNPYVLKNTGQGLNRVQPSPNVLRSMHEILSSVQKRVGIWVGSSVVHLGDYNVPNALVFIDKYAQVQRILGPLCTCIRRLGDIASEDKRSGGGLGRGVGKYVNESFGGVEAARKSILRDFFRYAFDGSGATDWFSAGSCIDGRLTSAWNWCSEVERKSYWPLMLLTGFTGFDGDF